ncbi:hypothetical protein [Sphingomonas glacialis]|uniref:hypothetical protein n=1 Tax=Sphingomonas glacialis TaxID=658225 RepID=UPI001128883B|nr:hypothetical protein [Sphingomonas glacialis]
MADDPATGVIAGLGIAAASGKTTASTGSGAIEAGILGSDAVLQTGGIIAGITNKAAGNRTVLVLAQDESVNLNQPDVVLERLAAVTALFSVRCKSGPNGPAIAAPDAPAAPSLGPVLPKDVIAATAVDTSISPITLSVADRMLIDAVLINGNATPLIPESGWSKPAAFVAAPTGTAVAAFAAPADVTMAKLSGSEVYRQYKALLALETSFRSCDTTEAKTALTTADALVTSLNAPGDKGAPSALINAVQLETVRGASTLVLRVAVEQAGGTLLTRTGVIYTLGFPGAAVISSGLLTSFRLSDPTTGKVVALGLVRCFLPPSRLSKVRDAVDNAASAPMSCSYQARVA